MFEITSYEDYSHIKFNHSKGNSIDHMLIREFVSLLDQLESSTKVLIIEGQPHFSVGMNLQHLATMSPHEVETLFSTYETFLQRLERTSYITIAKMTGYAMGAGAELALACDFRWMEQKAKIGFAGVNVGFSYNTKRLQRLVPRQLAKRLVLTGATLSAHQAYTYGIADRVLGHKRMEKEIHDFAHEFLEKSPVALQFAKAAFLDMEPERALSLSISQQHYKEGAKAFLEQRRPKWE